MPSAIKSRQKPLFIVGIDEAGRGPLAGPVSVGAVRARFEDMPRLRRTFRALKGKDSKKLNPIERDYWFARVAEISESGLLVWRVSLSSHAMIDRKGIVPAIRSALEKSLYGTGAEGTSCRVLLDGGLRAPKEFIDQQTIIKGDEKELLIGLASICAKVTRDRLMCRFAAQYPDYGFERHKGYATNLHCSRLKLLGPCKIHRQSYLKWLNSNLQMDR